MGFKGVKIIKVCFHDETFVRCCIIEWCIDNEEGDNKQQMNPASVI